MSDWDAIFGEAALGLDLAKPDLVPAGSGQAPARRSPRPSAPAQPDPHPDRPAGQAAASTADAPAGRDARPLQAARPSLKLVSRPAAPTTNPEAIFRREALEFRVRGRDTPGGVVRLGTRWIHWAYRMTLVLVLVAVAVIWIIRTDESSSGPAVVDGRTGTIAVLLPAVAGPDLTSSLTVTLPSGRSVGISGLHAQLADDTAIRRAGLEPLTQPAILLTGQLKPGAAATLLAQDAHLHYEATVVLRSESLADVLASQFGAMLGTGTSP
ncbi:MAG TPA: hypothetical protein VGL33_24860 [Streptosporangiaceae bacterium]|jgi:hypothetical protein